MNYFKKLPIARIAFVLFMLFVISFVLVSSAHARAHLPQIQGVNAGLATVPVKDESPSSFWSLLFGAPGKLIGWALYTLSTIFATVAAVAIGIAAWGISVVLSLNGEIMNTPLVQIGFSVALSIVNLGFVLAIVVIAIATILRSESYGIKQTLYKLILAAVLVNFSLVIAGPIIHFTNGLTFYFLNCATGDCSNSAGAWEASTNFAVSLTGAFQPQQALTFIKNDARNVPSGALVGMFEAGAGLGQLIIPFTTVSFIMVIFFVIFITLTAFNILLFVRFVVLGILLVLMPFVWLMWIFPATSGQWTRWWKKFIEYALFAPTVVFFLYLAMAVSKQMAGATGFSGAPGVAGGGAAAVLQNASNAGTNPIFAAINAFMTGTFSTVYIVLLQQLVVVALAVGGMIAAKHFSIHGADVALKATQAGVKAAGVWTGKTAARVGLRGAARLARKIAPATVPPTGAYPGATYSMHPIRSRIMPAGLVRGLDELAASDELKTKGQGAVFGGGARGFMTGAGKQAGGLISTVWGETKKGIFKGKNAKQWECENCISTNQPTPNIIWSVKKPGGSCATCGADAATAHWTEI